MALPDVIEIVPLQGPVHAEITVPGSKSLTNRALVLAALAEGEATLQGALWSEDTQMMVECLQELGFMVNVAPDPNEVCNRTITVFGQGGKVPRGGTVEQPLELFVGNAGTAARFLAALVCLGDGVYRLQGVARMHERPQAALFQALRQLGYRVDSPNDRLPALIHGAGPRAGACHVSIEESSQFASALLLCAKAGGWDVTVTGENAEESPYVAMTSQLIAAFPHGGGILQVEPDASSGSYFWGAAAYEFISAQRFVVRGAVERGLVQSYKASLSVSVAHWPTSGWQMDAKFLDYLGGLLPLSGVLAAGTSHGLETVVESFDQAGLPQLPLPSGSPAAGHPPIGEKPAPLVISRRTDLGDSIMTAITLAPLAENPIRFTDLGRLRLQECERVVALRTELTRCGAKVIESGDTLEVFPSPLHGAEIETYHDHRLAMCFAILGLKIPGIKIKNPACVKKTFPNFFQKLAAAPPRGLGVTIRDASGVPLAHEQLFAD